VPLNRFDEILEDFNTRYGIKQGPQTKKFGISLLVEGSEGFDEGRIRELGYGSEGDRDLAESILDFTRLLLEKCGNRSLYNSGELLNELLNTTSLPLLHCTLRLGLCLAQRYRDRHRPGHFHQPALSTYYKLDVSRIEKLAMPIPRPHQVTKKSGSTSPVKSAKGKEKSTRPGRRRMSTVDPNDFRSLFEEGYVSANSARPVEGIQGDGHAWVPWAESVLRPPTSPSTRQSRTVVGASPTLASPTSARRRSAGGAPGFSRLSSAEDANGSPDSRMGQAAEIPTSTSKPESSVSGLINDPIEQVLATLLPAMPDSLHYEFLQKLRTAHGLIQSPKSRQDLLSIRLLSRRMLIFLRECSDKIATPRNA